MLSMTCLTGDDGLSPANDWERMRLLLLTLRTEVELPCNLGNELLDMAVMLAQVNCGEEITGSVALPG